MKRLICLFLVLCLLLGGCASRRESMYVFYYLRSAETIAYGTPEALVAPLSREITGGNDDLNYLLQLYLDGPGNAEYLNPIPRGTYLLSTIFQEDTLVIVLSREFSTLDNIHLSLAGACLTATCHALTGFERIQVQSNEQIYDFDLNNYTFIDNSADEGGKDAL